MKFIRASKSLMRFFVTVVAGWLSTWQKGKISDIREIQYHKLLLP